MASSLSLRGTCSITNSWEISQKEYFLYLRKPEKQGVILNSTSFPETETVDFAEYIYILVKTVVFMSKRAFIRGRNESGYETIEQFCPIMDTNLKMMSENILIRCMYLSLIFL